MLCDPRVFASSPLRRWSLNPCFNGICSATRPALHLHLRGGDVSILVLMEYALRQALKQVNGSLRAVSILVLMEYALRPPVTGRFTGQGHTSLNPCFNGICSATYVIMLRLPFLWFVSILVLMEYALRPEKKPLQIIILKSQSLF